MAPVMVKQLTPNWVVLQLFTVHHALALPPLTVGVTETAGASPTANGLLK